MLANAEGGGGGALHSSAPCSGICMGVGTPVSEDLAWSYDEVRALQQSVRDMQDDVQVKAQELSERDSALSSLRE